MKVKFWGVRGSLPVPGRKTERYGGNTSCVEVRSESGTRVVVDAGTGIRKLGKELVAESEGQHRGPPPHQPHPLGSHPGAAVLLAALPEGQPPVTSTRASATTCTCAPCSRRRPTTRTSRSRSTRPRPTSPSASCPTRRTFEISGRQGRVRAPQPPVHRDGLPPRPSTARASSTSPTRRRSPTSCSRTSSSRSRPARAPSCPPPT